MQQPYNPLRALQGYRYKGIDHRIREHLITKEISIGSYVLSGGELAACVICDSIIRLIPGALTDETSALSDSFQDGLLAPPIYTAQTGFIERNHTTMRENITSKTELQILASAEKLFLEKGFKSTSTTDIARDAGCNQALVHYYFRTKENLFKRIFDNKFELMIEFIDSNLKDECDIFENLNGLINAYLDFISQNPNTPYFLLNEFFDNPERRTHIRKTFLTSQKGQEVFLRFCGLAQRAVREGSIRDIDPLDLIFDILSLAVFSFIATPILIDLLGRDQAGRKEFAEHRKEEIITLLTQGLKPLSLSTDK